MNISSYLQREVNFTCMSNYPKQLKNNNHLFKNY